MRSENHGVTGFESEHRVAHRSNDRIGNRSHGADHAHGLRNEDHIGFSVFTDDAARLFVLQIVPDNPGFALVLENLVFVYANARFIHGHPRQNLGIVVNVFADAFHDGIDLLLRNVSNVA